MDELMAMRGECQEIETEVSYVRRLAQARMEILRAEQERRASGGDLGDLVEALPRILADSGSRAGPVQGRVPRFLAPDPEISWTRGLESLVSDSTLANLPLLEDAQLEESLEQLRLLEREVSASRQALHRVIDQLDGELGRRRKDDLG